ncbi:MAG: nuclease-related domain-containing protein [Cyanobacteria bacterium P01_H01_bin.162]
MKKRSQLKRRSPLTDHPLRNPGQSLDEEIDRLVNDEGSVWIALFSLCFALPAMEWWRWFRDYEPNPIVMSIVVLPLMAVSLFKLLRIRQRVKRLRMARDGEKAVGQFLSELREKGYRIFHDILGDEFNIDHIIISDRGIFTVETKTYSKPTAGRPEVHFDGKTLLVNGYPPYRDPITQAQAQAAWSQRILKESTGKEYPVKAVIVFPGWFVQSTPSRNQKDPWVLNPKALPAFIDHVPPRLQPADVQLAAYHLSRYIRTKQP